jgi:hypothetical protein
MKGATPAAGFAMTAEDQRVDFATFVRHVKMIIARVVQVLIKGSSIFPQPQILRAKTKIRGCL